MHKTARRRECTHLEALEEGHLLAESGHHGRLLEDGAGDAGGEVAALVQAVAHVVRQLLRQRQVHDPALHRREVHLVVGVQEVELPQHARHVAHDTGNLGPHLLQLVGRDLVAVRAALPAAVLLVGDLHKHTHARYQTPQAVTADGHLTGSFSGMKPGYSSAHTA